MAHPMDVVSHFDLKHPLFSGYGGAGLYRSAALVRACDALLAAVLACESPIVLTGAAGVGKSALLGEVARQLAARGNKTAQFSSPARAIAGNLPIVNVALIDEADSADRARIAAIVETAARHGTTLIFSALDSANVGDAVRCVRLSPMDTNDAYDFVLDAAMQANRPDLFSAAAQESIVAASHGLPRLLKRIVGAAAMEAMFEGSSIVEARHVARAVRASGALPPPPEPDFMPDAPASTDRPEPPAFVLLEPAEAVTPEIDDETDAAAIEEIEAPRVAFFVPQPPETLVRQRRFDPHDARGVIVGAAALVLLLAAAAAYGLHVFGIDRLTAPRQPRSTTSQRAPTAAPPPRQALLLLERTGSLLPAPAVDVAELYLEVPEITPPPPLPTPATPGYRPPSPTLPTIAAATRAGLPTAGVGSAPRRAKSMPAVPLSLGKTEPLVDGNAPAIVPADATEIVGD